MLQCYVSTDTPFHSVFLLISAQSLVVVHFVFLEQRLHCTEHVIRVVNLVQRPTRVRVGHGIHVDDVKPGLTHGGHCVGTEKGNSLKRQTIKMWHKLIPYRADRPALLDSILSSKPSSQSSESRELELSGTRSKQRKLFEITRLILSDQGLHWETRELRSSEDCIMWKVFIVRAAHPYIRELKQLRRRRQRERH